MSATFVCAGFIRTVRENKTLLVITRRLWPTLLRTITMILLPLSTEEAFLVHRLDGRICNSCGKQ